MTDPLRTDRAPNAGDVPELERDARVEELLVLGLDHYFNDQHDLAISVWTRVLFLDRGHARARAYIERARSAIAEHQRENEELLHAGVAAFDGGDAVTARRLLTSAVERGASSEEALAVLERLNRLELAAPGPGTTAEPRALRQTPISRRDPIGAPAREKQPSRLAWVATGLVAGLSVAAAAAWLWTRGADGWASTASTSPPGTVRVQVEPLPVPTAAENALFRGRSLYERGRLHDALAALEAVSPGDALRARADELRAKIQGELLAASRGVAADGRGSRAPER